ncbi:beta-ketoacyl-[acyl-carrier-protein] synthase family protein, partial [Desulfobacterales bacterium HSG16]|nr:beta-ketoacyl-[acyl-carrier-protein] synthase family protein [Desulfobacterales bacterium HSG16]
RYLTTGAKFALAAALKAVKGSGLDKKRISSAGIIAGVGPNMDIGSVVKEISEGIIDEKNLRALWLLEFLPNSVTAAISFLTGIHGENITINSACATSLQAVGEGFRKIKDRYLDIVLAGGGDSRISQGGILAYKKAYALYKGDKKPEKAVMPFDKSRGGFVMGEGSGCFILEELDHALERGANILAEVIGYGVSLDGGQITAPDSEGIWAEKAVNSALKEACVEPDEIDVISAHGTGTLLNDSMETRLINRVFSKSNPLVIALKSWVGHLSTACGAAELSICLGLLENNFVPKIRNLESPCDENIKFVRENMEISFDKILLQNFGFGGQNAALVVKKWNHTKEI